MKHTPAPWVVDLDSYTHNDKAAVFVCGGSKQYPVPVCTVGPGREESNANAFLIAAAPDLLAALEEAIKSNPYGVCVNGVWGDWRDAAAAAIAKATGDCNCRPCAFAKAKGQA